MALRVGMAWPSLDALLFLIFFFSCYLFITSPFSLASDAIFPGQSLAGNQTRVSKGGLFELGFFRPGKSSNYYVGIWYKRAPSNSPRTVIWVANRERPISEASSSELRLSGDGNLVLFDHLKTKIWSSNLSSPATNSTVAVLHDTGNLILAGGSGSSAVLWQSFEHPTDTWLPGGRVGRNGATGEYMTLTSWRSPDDPAPGPYSFGVDPGSDQLVQLWNGSKRYWSSGLWNGQYFAAVPEMTRNQVYNYTYMQRDKYITYILFDTKIITRFEVNISGEGIQWAWLNNSADWMLVWLQPRLRCDTYARCGAFSLCRESSSPSCTCLDGFEPASSTEWDSEYWRSGCVRRTSLQCGHNASIDGEKDKFRMLDGMQWPKDYESLAIGSKEECEAACLSDCSCSAYAYGEDSTGCYIWKGNLLNLRSSSTADAEGRRGAIYLRLAASEMKTSKGGKGGAAGTIVGIVGGVTLSLGIVFLLVWRCRRRGLAGVSKAVKEGPLALFKYRDLQTLTNNFSERLGEGGFGCVFKGMLPGWGSVAVKRLQGLRQGEKQFRAEVTTMGTVQHVNVVRLLGFCCEGDQRLLVYDYMPNGSLGSCLFNNSSETLSWEQRYQIALGTARGLAYLHEKCRDCIIHCDIKPENILLDAEFGPKVADFGMAKLLGREFSRVLTSMRGTVGYLAPEWLSGLPITPKTDVYSYGMVLFEIVSGRRNMAGGVGDGKLVFLPLLAAELVAAGGDVLQLLDGRLDGNASMEELERVCSVACWCIQDQESQRPSMGLVVQALEGTLAVNKPPMPTSLQHLVGVPYVSSVMSSDPLASDTA